VGSKLARRTRVFDLHEVSFRHPDRDHVREFSVVEAPDWINIIPLTADRQVVMVRQYRVGIEDFTLEIPGGMCDPGEDPRTAACREMREESGYDSDDVVPLGWVHPNPAVQTNRCHTFLARNARQVANPDPDPDEILEVTTVPLDDVPGLIADGTISHALVIAAFHLYGVREIR
jgi:8-oxo-dGTP pyrophosphatase MutT (NUDIX family)